MDGLWEHIDGSTSTIPLTEALYSSLNGGDSPPIHHTTSEAYRRLITKDNIDLLFVIYPSEIEFQMIEELGVELEIIPVVKDALVFLVNEDNPVDNASLSNLREIYTGDISEWSILGGSGDSIIPYQRALGSGNQTMFLNLVMNDVEPMTAPTELVVRDMGSLVKFVSNYDNSINAIGYSTFYYVNNMYGNNKIKLLGVDGIVPSRDTIISGDYALCDNYYAVIRKDTPEDSPIRALISWLLTDEGQEVAAEAGYIPLHPLSIESSNYGIDPIYLGNIADSSGTGGTVPKSNIGDIVVNGMKRPLSDIFYDGYNYIQYINKCIWDTIYFGNDDLYGESFLKRPYAGIPADYPNYEMGFWQYSHIFSGRQSIL